MSSKTTMFEERLNEIDMQKVPRTQEEVDAIVKVCRACEHFTEHDYGPGPLAKGRTMEGQPTCSEALGCSKIVRFMLPRWKCKLGRWDKALRLVSCRTDEENNCPVKPINSVNGSIRTIPTEKSQIYLFDCHGRKVLFDCNSLELSEVSDEIYHLAKESPSILSDIGWSPSKLKPQFAPALSPRVKKVVINVTHLCNLGCKYCFVRNYYDDQAATISIVTARRALLQMFGERDQIATGFFGGEPLMAFPVVQDIVDFVEHENKKRGFKSTKFHITTNATCITKHVVRFLKEHNFSMIVSLDGDEQTHNEMRPFRDTKRNSYQETIAGLGTLAAHGYETKRITLRSTFTGAGVDLVGRLVFLNKLIDKGLAGHCSVEPACLSESTCLEIDDELRNFDRDRMEAEFAHEYHEAAIWYVAQIKEGKKPHFNHFDKIMKRLYYGSHAVSECGGGKGYFGVSPDGTITACHREHGSKIGHIDYGIDEELRAKWLDNRLYARNRCPSCPIKYICGGSCRMDSIVIVNDIRTPPDVVCWFKLTWFRECVWIFLQLTKQQIEHHVGQLNRRKKDEPGRKR